VTVGVVVMSDRSHVFAMSAKHNNQIKKSVECWGEEREMIKEKKNKSVAIFLLFSFLMKMLEREATRLALLFVFRRRGTSVQ
jgi:hypothetical protein